MIRIQKPTEGQLESIETQLRLVYAKLHWTPKQVRLAGEDRARLTSAWRNEALRYFYMVVRKGLDPLQPVIESHLVDERGDPL